MPIATSVVADTDILASDFNRLVDAVQDTTDGHDHSGDEGKGTVVDHANLSGATDDSVGGHTHAQIDDYMTNFLIWGGDSPDTSKALRLEAGVVADSGWSTDAGTGHYYKDFTTGLDYVVGAIFNPSAWDFEKHPVTVRNGVNGNVRIWCQNLAVTVKSGFFIAWGYMT